MTTPNEGVQNIPAEDPGQEPVVETAAGAAPEAGQGEQPGSPNPPAVPEPAPEAVALAEAMQTLEAAEKRIVELKRELKGRGEGEAAIPEVGELQRQITELREKVTSLESGKTTERDEDIEKLQASRKKISELSAALVAKKTVARGTAGGNQAPLAPPEAEPRPLARTPEEIAVLARRGMDRFGKKIKP